MINNIFFLYLLANMDSNMFITYKVSNIDTGLYIRDFILLICIFVLLEMRRDNLNLILFIHFLHQYIKVRQYKNLDEYN